ncbi:hypothetical protein D9601_14390 [Sphingomonas sp. MA1305]|uniref:hypothetical protein n=1 Tax=Sphingomonas sp. MA1305 TaxID=2479204 RepID=UPI0018E047FF|nr:hypothetical protein [Sphingomonas sp. MA1305]MBI0476535.1 hypothetical protein [Sphingomonas sp. MA1305]
MRFVLPLVLLTLGMAAPDGRLPPPAVIWQGKGAAIETRPCPPGGDHDASCRSLWLRSDGMIRPLGAGYLSVEMLSDHGDGPGDPDLVILGNDGGSGGDGDLFAIRFGAMVTIDTVRGERFTAIRVTHAHDGLRVMLPFDIEYFNGAAHAGAVIVPLPVRWRAGRAAADVAAMTHTPTSAPDLFARETGVRRELAAWATDVGATLHLYPPAARSGTGTTLHAMAELILSGHADVARAMLHRAWSRRPGSTIALGGEESFWRAICRAMVGQPLWQRFALDQLPHADLVARAA